MLRVTDYTAKDMGKNEHVAQGEVLLQHFVGVYLHANCRRACYNGV
jgi:hypothetical protein